MTPRDPIAHLPTHEVINMPPHMGDQDLWADDRALRHWASHMGGAGHAGHFAHVGHLTGLDETFEKANQANRHGPELQAFDRYGMRINAVAFHPAYHDLMDLAISNKVHNFAWHNEGNAGHLGWMNSLKELRKRPCIRGHPMEFFAPKNGFMKPSCNSLKKGRRL